MPVFLLVAVLSYGSPADAQESRIDIIFGATDADLSKYDFTALNFLFGGNGLPQTYKASTTQSELDKMKNDPGFAYIELDLPVKAAEIVANDPYFPLSDNDEDRQWYLRKIKMPEAWVFGSGSRSVKVAVIDTGVHASHLDLNDGRVIEGFNVVTGRVIPAGSDSDDNGHGTAVAGVIGAISNNSRGVAGVAWDVSIIPVKALEANGSGTISSVATAIVWAAQNGANIINLSLGGPGFGNDQTLNNAIIHAYNSGSLIVAAAGNDLADHGINLDNSPVYPICADGGNNMVIGVAASDVNDQKASFSNYGINCVDIVAPGKKILTTAFIPSDPSDNILIYGSGTSLAAPVVSGVAALLKSNNPNLTNTEIKNILLRTTDNIDSLNQDTCFGASCNGFLGRGRLNALSALSPQPVLNGQLVREAATGNVYQVTGGKKKLVSSFVFNQRKLNPADVLTEINNQLANYTLDTPLLPLKGTLIKGQTDPTVYFVDDDVKRPLTFLVFQSRGFRFGDVVTLPETDLLAIPTGEWYWPPDGTMVLIKGNPTVYVMHNGVKRPVTYFVFTQRRLSFSRVVEVTQDEFGHIPNSPDQYWLPPLENTLVKSEADPTVYIILDGIKRPVTYEAFVSRNLSFASIKVLPQAEMDIIQTGSVLSN